MHSQENASDSILFSIAVAHLGTYSSTKKENHVMFFLQKTAGPLLLIPSNISDTSIAL